MNIERTAQKLRPLMPQRVSHWLRVRATADPDLKTLIEKEIIQTAYNVLGDFENKMLLSLPTPQKSNGQINLGTIIYEKEKWPFALSLDELMQNMAIFGRSGAGKTNVSFHILRQLVDQNIPFLFLDWKQTARHLIPRLRSNVNVFTPGRNLTNFEFNPFITPPNLTPRVYINYVVDVMADAFTLGDGSKSVLQKAISSCHTRSYPILTRDIIAAVENMPSSGRQGGWKASALRALESLEFAGIGNLKTSPESLSRKLLTESSIIELDALNENAKEFITPLLCRWLYQVKLTSGKREKLSHVIFVEEAHHILRQNLQRAKESLMETLLRQCREIGIGMVIIDQHPSLISSVALGNTYTSICLNLKGPSDINKAASLSLIDTDDKKHFSKLPVGRSIVKLQDNWMDPFVVQFPLVNIEKGSVSDDILRRYLTDKDSGVLKRQCSSEFWRRNLGIQIPVEFDSIARLDGKDGNSHERLFRLLLDIAKYREDGVDARYRRLGMSAGKGHELKKHLIASGLVEEQVVHTDKTRKTLLRVTTRARESLGLDERKACYESIVHEYWKRFYSEQYAKRGFAVTMEAPRQSGRVDVVATKDGKTVAIEIETGKSDFMRNIKQDLISRYGKVLVVATDKAAFDRIEKELAKVGLLGMNRIELLLRGTGS
jgi:Helicase HerA, central domain